MTDTPTNPSPSPDEGRVALDAMAKDTAWAQGISQTTARAIVAHVSALEARALAAEGERDRYREAVEFVSRQEPKSWHDAWNILEYLVSSARAALTPPTEGETP